MINAPTLETLHLVNLEDKNLKWFISSRNKDKFPKLSTLIVQDSKISRNMYEALAAVFPSIEHLTCINELEPALVMLRDYQGWSNISTISLWGDVNEQATNILVRDVLRTRMERDKHIAKLCIPNKPPLVSNFPLREYVSLEYMRPLPPWPAWSGIFEGPLFFQVDCALLQLIICIRVVSTTYLLQLDSKHHSRCLKQVLTLPSYSMLPRGNL